MRACSSPQCHRRRAVCSLLSHLHMFSDHTCSVCKPMCAWQPTAALTAKLQARCLRALILRAQVEGCLQPAQLPAHSCLFSMTCVRHNDALLYAKVSIMCACPGQSHRRTAVCSLLSHLHMLSDQDNMHMTAECSADC